MEYEKPVSAVLLRNYEMWKEAFTMTRVYETVREAAELWVSQFNAIPQGMLDRLMR